MTLRPEFMWLDPLSCVQCGLCEQFVPDISRHGQRLPVTGQSLDAMAACPVGAIRWLEREEQDESDRRT